jgi:hypothetical protein
MIRPSAVLLALAVSTSACATLAGPGSPIAGRKPRLLEVVGTMPGQLRESSGVAVSRTQPGVLWSHNDSGNSATLYALDMSGRLMASIDVAGVMAVDWEDIAAGPCPAGPTPGGARSCLYIADTGDNNRVREAVTVYVVVEPTVDKGTPPPAVTARPLHYRYPGGPEDVEALAVLPDGDLVVVSRGRSGRIDFFGLTADAVARGLSSGETMTIDFQNTSDIRPDAPSGRLATGAAISPDGTTLAVRTYYEVYFFAMEPGRRDRVRWVDTGRGCALGDAEPQGEGIDYLDAGTLVLTSEQSRGRPGEIHRLRC